MPVDGVVGLREGKICVVMRALRVLWELSRSRSRPLCDYATRSVLANSAVDCHPSTSFCRHLVSLAPRILLAPRAYPSGDNDRWNAEYNTRLKDQDNEERFGKWLAPDAGDSVAGRSSKDGKKKKIQKTFKHTRSFRLRTEKYMQPFWLDVFMSKRFITASVMHRVTSRVVAVCNTNSKEFRGRLKSYSDVGACKMVAEKLAERAIEADVYAIAYEPRKNEKFEGKLKTLVETVGQNGIHLYLPNDL